MRKLLPCQADTRSLKVEEKVPRLFEHSIPRPWTYWIFLFVVDDYWWMTMIVNFSVKVEIASDSLVTDNLLTWRVFVDSREFHVASHVGKIFFSIFLRKSSQIRRRENVKNALEIIDISENSSFSIFERQKKPSKLWRQIIYCQLANDLKFFLSFIILKFCMSSFPNVFCSSMLHPSSKKKWTKIKFKSFWHFHVFHFSIFTRLTNEML